MYGEENYWSYLKLFQSADYSKKFLNVCYSKQQIKEPDSSSFNNCYSFMYYLEQGELYLKESLHTPLSIKPILIFYGYVHLIKACVLTVDPKYPETTSVLAHGVTTRKRKKQQYSFLKDEVKIQRNGLFSHFTNKMFHVKHMESEKFKMEELLSQIPELAEAFYYLLDKNHLIELGNNNRIILPNNLINHFHMSDDLLKQYLTEKMGEKVIWLRSNEIQLTNHGFEAPPIRFNLKKHSYFFSIYRNNAFLLPEPIIYYLTLYNLSMIARYEIEWWMELLKSTPNEDFPIIDQFVSVVYNKIPYFITSFLKAKIKGENI
ncbi:hypothetical protein JOC86_005002 [Bacillus pakistanensis]|uniref:YaaC-like Protein n=1 Tax=Rossellomorea pakistanensis TaxID=992288 RepID=A0ABS2NKN1_9BACI|nr:YaaC family protein [Bacillus pakistanensis]MBM7588389.1 hypothetical protein [Bacillus pakistanensis]